MGLPMMPRPINPILAMCVSFVFPISMGFVDGIRLHPSQACDRLSRGAIFATEPSLIADFVEQAEEIFVANLAGVGFIAFRATGDLDVPAVRRVELELGGEVPFH